jgi:hypothetical protein
MNIIAAVFPTILIKSPIDIFLSFYLHNNTVAIHHEIQRKEFNKKAPLKQKFGRKT